MSIYLAVKMAVETAAIQTCVRLHGVNNKQDFYNQFGIVSNPFNTKFGLQNHPSLKLPSPLGEGLGVRARFGVLKTGIAL
ncbi:MAG: hypothetical protein KME17_05150 [Cyanosarcina radialis HA8281-LM2]|jgi:hypothetical protein|nr:hypothetical protein [Cyanosarcina radialis HA8281-LM2]